MSAVVSQVHDYEPGIQPNGVFWTVPVSPDSVNADLTAGTASFQLDDYPIPDFASGFNSLANGPSVPAHVTFDLQFAPGANPRRFEQTDNTNGFAGDYTEGAATIEWSSHQDGFAFTSDPAATSTSLFAIVGHERDGVYFADNPSRTTGETSSSPASAGPNPDLPATGDRHSLVVPGALAALAYIVHRRARLADLIPPPGPVATRDPT